MTIWILHALVIGLAALVVLLVERRKVMQWLGAAQLVCGIVLFLTYADFLRLPWADAPVYLSFLSFAGWIAPAVFVSRKATTMAVALGLWGAFILLTGHAGWLTLR